MLKGGGENDVQYCSGGKGEKELCRVCREIRQGLPLKKILVRIKRNVEGCVCCEMGREESGGCEEGSDDEYVRG